jgi:hypothetical protein
LRHGFQFSAVAKDSVLDLSHCTLLTASYGNQLRDDADFVQVLREIVWTILGLLRKSYYEQARAQPASDTAWLQLDHRVKQASANVLTEHDATAVLTWIVREAERGFGEADECVQSLLDSLAGRWELLDQVRLVKQHYDDRSPKTLLGKQNQLRAMCLLAERPIVDLAGKRFDTALRPLSVSDRDQRRSQLELIDKGLELCRVLSPEGAKDSSHDPYHFRFRARLQLAKVRLQWPDLETPELFCEVDWLVESARASVSADDHERMSRLEMTWAEGLLLQATVSLNRPCPDHAAREQAQAAAASPTCGRGMPSSVHESTWRGAAAAWNAGPAFSDCGRSTRRNGACSSSGLSRVSFADSARMTSTTPGASWPI